MHSVFNNTLPKFNCILNLRLCYILFLMKEEKAFKKETAGNLMTSKVPVVAVSNTVHDVRMLIKEKTFDDSDIIYVISETGELVGSIPISKIVKADKEEVIKDFVSKPPFVANAHTDQEKVVIEAIKNDVQDVPVVDHENHFLGAVTAHHLIDILHEEHLEDFLRSTGIRGRGKRITELITVGVHEVVLARVPWLITGLSIGIGITLLASFFETSLRENITLVFFMPVITYMSAAIGTQSETIFIRAITLLKLRILNYILRELMIGFIIGIVVGIITGFVGYILSSSESVGIVIGVSLVISMTFAPVLAIITPLILKALGRDPAVGSGPFSTAIQDFISLLIYFSIATIVLQNV